MYNIACIALLLKSSCSAFTEALTSLTIPYHRHNYKDKTISARKTHLRESRSTLTKDLALFLQCDMFASLLSSKSVEINISKQMTRSTERTEFSGEQRIKVKIVESTEDGKIVEAGVNWRDGVATLPGVSPKVLQERLYHRKLPTTGIHLMHWSYQIPLQELIE
jgi:hypothetical protein